MVRDASMRPTLEEGDRLLVDARAFRERSPRPGDIVVLADPQDASRWLVKRVLAVGPVRVWRAPTGEVTAEAPAGPGAANDPIEAVVVPPSFVFVSGDARDVSRDSRRFGPVPVAALVGRVFRRYAPAGRRRDF